MAQDYILIVGGETAAPRRNRVQLREAPIPTTIDATFDGQVFRPIEPISLPPDTVVRLTVEAIPKQPKSFREVARSLNVEGPPDWASNLDHYLYGNRGGDAE